MKSPIFALSLFALFLAAPIRAETWKGHAVIRFQGASTLHDFRGQGTTDVFEAAVALQDSNAATVTCSAPLPVKGLSTDNTRRDKAMFAMFHADEFPVVVGSISDVVVDARMPAEVPVSVSILGKEQQVEAEITNASFSEGHIAFHVFMDVSLKASGLKPPTVIGLIRVGDIVHVSADIELTRGGAHE
jgi:polyisoprenoid-binding protein YceI